jgi:uncharacterized protein YjbI with pentapeptide repeats
MQTLKRSDVEAVMLQHHSWLRNEEDGICADLSKSNMNRLDLSMYDFTGADLTCCSVRGCVFNHTVLLAHTTCTELKTATII